MASLMRAGDVHPAARTRSSCARGLRSGPLSPLPVRLDDSTVGFFLPLLMHLALVSQEYPPETAKGGLGTQTLAKARGMRRRGHEVTVISRTSERGWTDRDD